VRYLNRILASALVCAIGAVQPVWADQADWHRFRANYPYHIQTIVLGPDAPGGRTLIVSEPPPNVTIAMMQERWPVEFKDAVIHKHAVGVDGWVADIVTWLPPQSENATRELVQQLTGYLFGTSYKSYVSPIEPAARGGRADLDVAVSTGQLSRWLGLERPAPGPVGQAFSGLLWIGILLCIIALVRTRRFRWVKAGAACAAVLFGQGYFYEPPPPEVRFVERHTSGRPQSMDRILNGGGGVYNSDTRGLVLLVLPRTASLDSNPAALREFLLDTDAILGAVGTDRTTAIVGRERIVPVDLMPPLRVETLLQLASVKSVEMARSDELRDTEYGSLLDITDQLLKSWSRHGDVRWNTGGVGHLDAVGGFKLLAFARTGSLPVDYLGDRDSRLRNAEDTAYEHFATSGDPNLARVVQYTGAYQIFRLFEISGINPYPTPHASPDRAGLNGLTGDAKVLGERQKSQSGQPRLGPMMEVLKAGNVPITERGLGSHAGARVSSATWIYQGEIHGPHAAWLKTLERPGSVGIVIERQPSGLLLSVQGDSASIYAPDTVSAIDAFVARARTRAAGASKVDVTFANFDAEQARGFIRSAELHSPYPLRGRVNAMIQVDGNGGAIARARQIEWNAAGARLESRQAGSIGPVEHQIEIPAARGAVSPLRLVIDATAEASSRVRTLLSEFMFAIRSLRSADELFAALHDFMARLMVIPGVKEVRPIQIGEAGDTFIVRHEGAGIVNAAG
jgi:hypothetical protein